jgi:hypothetical protein
MARARAAIAALPFVPTAAQRRAVNEIVSDMKGKRAMHRLLVGDVGTGKTVVALLAAVCAVEAGSQVAVMAPTEILAEQHFRTLSVLGRSAGVEPALWTGSTKESARRELRRRLALPAGDPAALDLVVGTHALLEDDVPLPRLGLVVVDEQHRFGVRQRAQLAAKGRGFPDVLVMTATPIPRTLASAFLGDLDISVLAERPKDHLPITTRVAGEARREAIYGFLAKELAKGRQAYVVYPLIDESEKSELRAARAMVESLKAHPVLAPFTFGLLHGRMKATEKEAVMAEFAANRVHALVSTTVIEVGVDVPNATVMIVEHPERFGLTQLHQLRGRVGRGSEKSVCVLLAGPRSAPEARARLALLAATDDGFKIAEADLAAAARRALGRRQTGMPALKVADILKDAALVTRARAEASAMVASDPELLAPQLRAQGAAGPPVRRGAVVAGDGLSGWRVACPACGAEYLLPAPWAGPGARVRCPGCGAAFRAADPKKTRVLNEALEAWARGEPGGLEAVQGARAAGFFWRAHGASLCQALAGGSEAALDRPHSSALARVSGRDRRCLARTPPEHRGAAEQRHERARRRDRRRRSPARDRGRRDRRGQEKGRAREEVARREDACPRAFGHRLLDRGLAQEEHRCGEHAGDERRQRHRPAAVRRGKQRQPDPRPEQPARERDPVARPRPRQRPPRAERRADRERGDQEPEPAHARAAAEHVRRARDVQHAARDPGGDRGHHRGARVHAREEQRPAARASRNGCGAGPGARDPMPSTPRNRSVARQSTEAR